MEKQIIDLTVPFSDLPQLFDAYEGELDPSLKDLLNFPLNYKKFSSILNGDYKTTYPYYFETAIEEFKSLAKHQASIIVHEAFFLQFSGLITAYLKTLDVILEQEGTIPLDWRYYIAIMVRII
jgi:hypothetical protein